MPELTMSDPPKKPFETDQEKRLQNLSKAFTKKFLPLAIGHGDGLDEALKWLSSFLTVMAWYCEFDYDLESDDLFGPSDGVTQDAPDVISPEFITSMEQLTGRNITMPLGAPTSESAFIATTKMEREVFLRTLSTELMSLFVSARKRLRGFDLDDDALAQRAWNWSLAFWNERETHIDIVLPEAFGKAVSSEVAEARNSMMKRLENERLLTGMAKSIFLTNVGWKAGQAMAIEEELEKPMRLINTAFTAAKSLLKVQVASVEEMKEAESKAVNIIKEGNTQ